MIRVLGLWLGRVIAAIALIAAMVAAAIWFWPDEAPLAPPRFDAALLPEDLDAWLAMREATLGDIVPGAEKRIVWAGEPGVRAPVAVVYLHGFSATSEEIRPVPDRVAAALGANLFFARLAGHGRDGAAMAAATAEDWLADLAEALAIGSRIGERVIVIATSTGGTLAIAGLGTPDIAAALPGAGAVSGLILVSPNLRLKAAAGRLLDLPLVEHWGHLVAGRELGFAPQSAEHALFWTEQYPVDALYPMARLMRAARAVDPAAMDVPLMVVLSEDDRVVDPRATLALADRWRGPASILRVTPGPGDDPGAHVIAGDILSPGLTETVAGAATDWARALPR
jgi:alpha-beta hydrolase superfamily lysophospholipase